MSYPELIVRLFLIVVGFVGAVVAPYWVVVAVIALLSLRFRAIEILFMGLLMDFLWVPVYTVPIPLFTILSIVLLWLFEPLRESFLFS